MFAKSSERLAASKPGKPTRAPPHTAPAPLTHPQLFELATGKPIKAPPLQTIRETARFALDEEGRWMFLGTASSDWDASTLAHK